MSRLACHAEGFSWDTGPGDAPQEVELDDQEFPNGWTLVAPRGWTLRQASPGYRLDGPDSKSVTVCQVDKALQALEVFTYMPAGWTIAIEGGELAFVRHPAPLGTGEQ